MAAVVQISTGPVTYDDSLGSFTRDSVPHADYEIHNHYEKDLQTYQMSLGSPDPAGESSVGIVRLGSPTLLWIAEWSACRLGDHPLVPDPAPPTGWVLLDANVTFAKVAEGPSGIDFIYRVEGTYVYAKKKPSSGLFTDMSYPLSPWLRDSGGFVRKIPLDKLKSLLDPAGGGGGLEGSTTTAAGSSVTGQGLLGPQGYPVVGK